MQPQKFKICRGFLKGRRFPYPAPSQGHSSFTPSLVKEAVFEILLRHINQRKHELSNYAFFDLCAGSGQMALEALSLGFRPVYISEVDAKRLRHIREMSCVLQRYCPAPVLQIYKYDFRRMLKMIHAHSHAVLYLDMPYSFWQNGKQNVAANFVKRLHESWILESQCLLLWLLVQGPRFLNSQELRDDRNSQFLRYGKQHLTLLCLENQTL